MPDLLREEEKRFVFVLVIEMGDEQWPANGEAEVVPAVEWSAMGLVKEVARIPDFVANKLVSVAVKLTCPGFSGDQNGAAGTSPILGAVVRRQYLEFPDGIEAGEND